MSAESLDFLWRLALFVDVLWWWWYVYEVKISEATMFAPNQKPTKECVFGRAW